MLFLEIDCHDEAVTIALDIEHDSFRSDDTRARIVPFHFGGRLPACLAHLVEPGVESCFKRRLVVMTGARGDEFPLGAPGYDPYFDV